MDNQKNKMNDLERIITEYQDSLFRFAFFRTGSLADSQDIVQEVFVKLFEQEKSLSSVRNLKSYLFRATSNSCTDYFRRKRPALPLERMADRVEESPDDDLTKEYERISAMLDTLPDEQAEVIRMNTLSGLRFTEIAEILDIPVTTVKSRFKYGIEKLRTKIN